MADDQPEDRQDLVKRLPCELVTQIFSNLDASTLATVSRVSSSWQSVISSSHVWQNAYLLHRAQTYATNVPVTPGSGQGAPSRDPGVDWKNVYKTSFQLEKNWRTGQARPIFLRGHQDSVYCLQFDEHKIVTGSRDRTIRVWDAHTYACKLVIGPPEVIHKASLPRDDGLPQHMATFGDRLRVAEQYSAVEPTSAFESRPAPTAGMQHSIESAAHETQGQYYAFSTPKFMTHRTCHDASVLCLMYDEHILVTGSSDTTCIVYDIKDDYRPIRRLVHHTSHIFDLGLNEDFIVTACKDNTIGIWSRPTGILLSSISAHIGPVNAIQLRGDTVISCSSDSTVKLWNACNGKLIRKLQPSDPVGLACCDVTEDGRYVAAAGKGKHIMVWDTATGECVHNIPAHSKLIRALHFDSEKGWLITGSYDANIHIYDVRTGQEIHKYQGWHPGWVLNIKANYRRMISTGQGRAILVYDYGSGVHGIDGLESEKGKLTGLLDYEETGSFHTGITI